MFEFAKPPIAWSRSAKFETYMAAMFPDVKYTVRTVNVAEIDVHRSNRNSSRLTGHLDPDRVDSMLKLARSMTLQLPAVVLRYDPQPKTAGSLVSIDGRHRIEVAIKTGVTDVLAYVVADIGDALALQLTSVMNTLEGVTSTREERFALGVRMLRESPGMTAARAASMLGLSANAISLAKRVDDLRAAFVDKGGPMYLPLHGNLVRSKMVLDHLAKIQNNRVLHELAKGLSAIKNIKVDRVAEVVKRVNAVRASEAAMLEQVAKELGEIEDDVTTPGRASASVKATKKRTPGEFLAVATAAYLSTLRRFARDDARDLLVDENTRRRFVGEAAEIRDTLQAITSKVPAGDKEPTRA